MFKLKTCNQNFPDRRFLVKCWTSMNGSNWIFWFYFTGKLSQNQWNVWTSCVTTLFFRWLYHCGRRRRLCIWDKNVEKAGSGGHVIRKKWFLFRLVKTCTTSSWIHWSWTSLKQKWEQQSLPDKLDHRSKRASIQDVFFKKMLDLTSSKDNRECEECIDMTVSVRNVLLRIHMCSDEIVIWLSIVCCLELTWSRWQCLFLIVPSERASRFVRQHDRAFSGGEIASVEGIPGWRSSYVLTKRQGSWHASWLCSLACTSSRADTVFWIKKRMGLRADISYSRGRRNSYEWSLSQKGLRMMCDSSLALTYWWEQRDRRWSAHQVFGHLQRYTNHVDWRVHSVKFRRESRATWTIPKTKFGTCSLRTLCTISQSREWVSLWWGPRQKWKNQRWRRAR